MGNMVDSLKKSKLCFDWVFSPHIELKLSSDSNISGFLKTSKGIGNTFLRV